MGIVGVQEGSGWAMWIWALGSPEWRGDLFTLDTIDRWVRKSLSQNQGGNTEEYPLPELSCFTTKLINSPWKLIMERPVQAHNSSPELCYLPAVWPLVKHLTSQA